MNNVAYGLIMQELGTRSLRSFASVQGALSMYAIMRGVPRSRSSYAGHGAKLIGCFSDKAVMADGRDGDAAKPDGSGWILNGTKRWIQRLDRRRRGGVGEIDQGIPGLSSRRGRPASLRATRQVLDARVDYSELHFDDAARR